VREIIQRNRRRPVDFDVVSSLVQLSAGPSNLATTIRLMAEAIPDRGILRVAPRLLPLSHPLVVDGTLNAITIETDMAGEITLIGKGAGSVETASAIIGDLLYIRDFHEGRHKKTP